MTHLTTCNLSCQEDTFLSEEDPGLVMTNKHHHHSLILLRVTNATVGRYYCVASNKHGQATKSILVTGLPEDIRVTSNKAGQLDSEYRLEWEAASKSHILEWRIEVRRERPGTPWDTYNLVTNRTDTNTGHFLITGLAEAAIYHVRVSARNEFGWRQSEQDFVFGTRGSGGADGG